MSKRVGIEIKLSALAAIKPALVVGFTILFMVPVRGLINLIFYREVAIDWTLAFILAFGFAALWYCASFLSAFFDLRRGDARDAAKNPSFPSTSFITGVYSSGVLLSVVLMWGLRHQHESVGYVIGASCFGLLSFFAWPRTIYCTVLAVTQRTRFGRLKRIAYEEVISISRSNDGITTVLGPNDTIEHTPDHADPSYFASVVSKRSGKQLY